MSSNVIILITLLACIVAFSGIVFGSLFLAKHKVNGMETLAEVDKGIGYAKSIADAVKPFLPGIAGDVVEMALKYAGQAVTRVEATYKAAIQNGTAVNDTRKSEATTMIQTALALEGIPMTSDTQKLIDTVIPLLVLALPKTNDDTVLVQAPEVVPVESAAVTDAAQNVTVTAQ
jgi:hypothetical protein